MQLPPRTITARSGGMIGNNSCGVHSVMGGTHLRHVERLEILTYDGLRTSVGMTSEEELRDILVAGGRRAEIYRSLDDFRHKYANLIRARYPLPCERCRRRSLGRGLFAGFVEQLFEMLARCDE
jgi:FAD/FMN-containing dehydrogenase